MTQLAILQFLIGAAFGLRFRATILVPMALAVIIEVLMLDRMSGSWFSIIWKVGVLLVAVEVGYVIGAIFRPAMRLRERGSAGEDYRRGVWRHYLQRR